MEKSNLIRLKSILNRYKLAHRMLGEDDIEIGGGNNIKYLKLYCFYIPLVIGSIIIITGFLLDFILFKFCGVPFVLYAVYGIGQIIIAIKNNRNTVVISTVEIRISINDVVTTLNSQNIKDYVIKNKPIDDKLYHYQFLIVDNQNIEHTFLTFIDDDLAVLKDNMNFLKDYFHVKMNATTPA